MRRARAPHVQDKHVPRQDVQHARCHVNGDAVDRRTALKIGAFDPSQHLMPGCRLAKCHGRCVRLKGLVGLRHASDAHGWFRSRALRQRHVAGDDPASLSADLEQGVPRLVR